jgi:hypothetical protein
MYVSTCFPVYQYDNHLDQAGAKQKLSQHRLWLVNVFRHAGVTQSV